MGQMSGVSKGRTDANRLKASAIAVVVTFPTGDCRKETAVIEAFEARLLGYVSGFEGRELGSHECIFYVSGDYSSIVNAASFIASELGLDSQRLAFRPVSSATPGKIRVPKAKPFDVFAVPLGNGSFGCVQLLAFEPEVSADLVKVYSFVSKTLPEIDDIVRSSELFPAVFTLVSVGMRVNGWKRLGGRAVDFTWPVFRESPSSFLRPGTYDDWLLWSRGHGYQFVGRLTEPQRRLEFLMTWAPFAIAERIVTGLDPALEVK